MSKDTDDIVTKQQVKNAEKMNDSENQQTAETIKIIKENCCDCNYTLREKSVRGILISKLKKSKFKHPYYVKWSEVVAVIDERIKITKTIIKEDEKSLKTCPNDIDLQNELLVNENIVAEYLILKINLSNLTKGGKR